MCRCRSQRGRQFTPLSRFPVSFRPGRVRFFRFWTTWGVGGHGPGWQWGSSLLRERRGAPSNGKAFSDTGFGVSRTLSRRRCRLRPTAPWGKTEGRTPGRRSGSMGRSGTTPGHRCRGRHPCPRPWVTMGTSRDRPGVSGSGRRKREVTCRSSGPLDPWFRDLLRGRVC